MSTNKWVDAIPKIIQPIKNSIPDPIVNFSIEKFLNQLFKEEKIKGELSFIAERIIEINVKDIDFSMFFTLENEKIKALRGPQEPDVTLSATGDALILLIYNKVDPDTLFFNRKLMVKGNTELGLHLKNFLDTIEVHQKLPKVIYLIGDRFSDFIYKEKSETIPLN